MIGAALDLGAGRRGVDMGPSANRYAGLAERTATLGREVIDLVEADWLKPFAEPSAWFTSAVLTSGQTYTFTFANVGKFTTVDPLNKN